MKKQYMRILAAVFTAALLFTVLSASAFAVSESEVEAQVAAAGRDSVAGNVFIWFLCAIAFLKISQKIDSFMSSLGVNVGHTGGNMMAELMIAARGVSIGKGLFGGGGSGRGGASGSNGAAGANGANGGNNGGGGATGFMSGGLMGVAGRRVHSGAAASAADNPKGGVFGGIGGKAFQSSLHKGGDFANNVISSVAHGNISQMGSITGDKAAAALQSYMPMTNVGGAENSVNTSDHADGDNIAVQQTDNSGTPQIPQSPGDVYGDDVPTASVSAEGNIPASAVESAPVTYSGVEIGGGRISGYETPETGGEARQFAMCSASQYMAPEGHYSTVTAIDDSKWYKQYAQAAVEKTPYNAPDGGVAYNERIIQKLPPMPRRKDRV